jgi:hypothetical protein
MYAMGVGRHLPLQVIQIICDSPMIPDVVHCEMGWSTGILPAWLTHLLILHLCPSPQSPMSRWLMSQTINPRPIAISCHPHPTKSPTPAPVTMMKVTVTMNTSTALTIPTAGAMIKAIHLMTEMVTPTNTPRQCSITHPN